MSLARRLGRALAGGIGFLVLLRDRGDYSSR